ncbi:lytic transglycosylase domain-containing protein [Aquamicrobium segne]|uniref:Lytic transglycosylase domain-containing protein n=1 Tax=Aquamicrobium segne TaxID=469547 RepID=A0ABW0H336_9HYPH
MNKLTVFTAAIAAAMLFVASGEVKADRFDPQLGGNLAVKTEAEVEKPATKKSETKKPATRKSEKSKAGLEKAKAKKTKARKTSAKTRYSTLINQYAANYGVPVSLAHAVIKVESNYRADALGRAGEVGLMQIKPATARMMGYSGSTKGLFHPETNIKYGMKYLAKAHSLSGGTTCGTILKYNAGHAAKRMNPVSSAYCSKVKGHMAAADIPTS